MNWLIGKTGYSLIDVWVLVHLSFWFFFGSLIWSFKFDRFHSLFLCLVLAVGWEFFERLGEKRWPHLWLSPESWWNAYLSDMSTVFIGLFAVWYALDNWRVQ